MDFQTEKLSVQIGKFQKTIEKRINSLPVVKKAATKIRSSKRLKIAMKEAQKGLKGIETFFNGLPRHPRAVKPYLDAQREVLVRLSSELKEKITAQRTTVKAKRKSPRRASRAKTA